LIFDHELRCETDAIDVHMDDSPAHVATPTRDPIYQDKLARHQRARFLDQTILRQDVEMEELGPAEDALEMDELVDRSIAMFRDELWSEFCRRHDDENSGNLPACELIPMLRTHVERFESDLLAIVHRHVIARLGDCGCDQWADEIRRIIEYQSYFELMSCRVLSHQTEEERFRPRLYLRADYQRKQLMTQLGSGQVAHPPVISETLKRLPVVGLLFHEMPIRFAAGPRGRIAVTEFTNHDET
jgi:hypothetical protein